MKSTSLKEFLQSTELSSINFLVDGSGMGIKKDAEDIFYVTDQDCKEQALYYLREKYKGSISLYLFRYLLFFFGDSREILSEKEVLSMLENEEITTESPDFIKIQEVIESLPVNIEAAKIIGLIQIVSAALSEATKKKKGISIYLEHPETHIHPNRQSKLANFLLSVYKDYGINDDNITVEMPLEPSTITNN